MITGPTAGTRDQTVERLYGGDAPVGHTIRHNGLRVHAPTTASRAGSGHQTKPVGAKENSAQHGASSTVHVAAGVRRLRRPCDTDGDHAARDPMCPSRGGAHQFRPHRHGLSLAVRRARLRRHAAVAGRSAHPDQRPAGWTESARGAVPGHVFSSATRTRFRYRRPVPGGGATATHPSSTHVAVVVTDSSARQIGGLEDVAPTWEKATNGYPHVAGLWCAPAARTANPPGRTADPATTTRSRIRRVLCR